MNLYNKFRHAILIIAICCLFVPNVVFAETATFDNLEEGLIGNQFTDDGITFLNLDNGNPDVEDVFIIEQGNGTLSDPSFSPPNGLTATAYTPGADLGYGAIKEMSMHVDGDADAVSIDFFTQGTLLYANTVTLEAIKDNAVVDEVSIAMSEVQSNKFTLALDGIVFDTVRLVSSPNSQVLLLDNVTITPTGTGGGCACDIDEDNDCDLTDHTLFRQDWGSDCQGGCTCDLDDDGDCDLADHALFRSDWNHSDCK